MMFAEAPRQQQQHPHHFTPPIYSPQPHLSSSGHGQFFLNDIQTSFKKSNPSPDVNNQRIFLRQTQYALPVQSQRQIEGGGQNAKNVSQTLRSEAGEHMLRRKTPNGTLSAGYDGTPVEWNSRPHADKHFLMPAADAVRYNMRQTNAFTGPNATTTFDGQINLTPVERSGSSYWQSQSSQPSPRYGNQNDGTNHSQIWLQSSTRQPLDSMLYQGPQIPLNFAHPGMYQHVPHVVQPMWPPTLGLTASNAQGRFGPYWPDGSFEPYVPAALRDGQLPPQFNNASIAGQVDIYNRQHQTLPDPLYAITPEHERNSWNAQLFAESRRHSSNTLSPAGSGGIRSYDLTPPLPRQQSDPNASFAHRAHAMSARLQRHGSEASMWPQMPNSGQLAQLALRTPSSPSNPHFKTRVLIWAHRIYINLIQHSRRHNQAKATSEKSQSIFPKPPRQSYQPARDGTTLQTQNQPNRSRLVETEPSDTKAANLTAQSNECVESQQWSNSNQRSSFHEKHDKGLRLSQPAQNRFQPNPADSRQSSAYTPAAPSSSTPILASPHHSVLEAKHALEILDSLCQESNWQWVDGILLGGCLAYGLEQFQAALKWYDRVLTCDPNNVEAISNAAAAFLSLKRRKEAEQYWLRAVKLRPSYFEAVEHLVGLLCSDQRAREAIKIIEHVESALKVSDEAQTYLSWDQIDGRTKENSNRTPFSADKGLMGLSLCTDTSSGYRISPTENGRMLSLIHAKGNMLYAIGDNAGAAKAFEDAIMIGSGRRSEGIAGLIKHVLHVFARFILSQRGDSNAPLAPYETILLQPSIALKTAELVFPGNGQLPGLREVPEGQSRKAAISVASNSLLSLAKIYQDGMSSNGGTTQAMRAAPGVQEILALYYLSLSLQPSPSTANNVGILLASVQQTVPQRNSNGHKESQFQGIQGVVPGSGIALALAYYNYGLNLDSRHAHLFTNLGSLLKDIGQLGAAIKMYEHAVSCDENFDIALANLANAVKDQGRISDAITFYKRAVKSSPDFAEAVCGLANALNSVCSWKGRGGVIFSDKKHDRWHVNEAGMLVDAREPGVTSSGWIGRVVAIVEKQLRDGKSWGKGILQSLDIQGLLSRNDLVGSLQLDHSTMGLIVEAIKAWTGEDWEGAKIVRLVERATRRLGWQMYQEKYVLKSTSPPTFARPQLPSSLAVPSAPTVLPFHTFTCPLTANQIRKISQRNGLRISCSTLRAPWLPNVIFDQPAPPQPFLKVGYVSSDFNNHPLAHLMQSVFGFHDPSRVQAICYATTQSDNSSHREQIQREAPAFYDASSWSIDKLVKQIVSDGIHILINLNGYTRGARNEVFAARPAPIQMSFMGFAGTLGAEWCDYLLADSIAVPPSMLRPWRGNVDLVDQIKDNNYSDDDYSDWVYGENIIFAKETFFCCDHRQSAPDAKEEQLSWPDEQQRRRRMRKELFPKLPDDTVILGNFNQLYKIEPTTFRTWLRILQAIPKAILWLLRFPDLGEAHLREIATQWASQSVASRIVFTDVAAKKDHIARARVCDLFLDTPECNAHTTAADVLWSGTPLLTLPRYEYKMCSRMAASILRGALPRGRVGDEAAKELTTRNDVDYEKRASELGNGLAAVLSGKQNNCRLLELRKMLYEGRWTSALFDTKRWVRDLEVAYEEAWRKWVAGEGGDIWLKDMITT